MSTVSTSQQPLPRANSDGVPPPAANHQEESFDVVTPKKLFGSKLLGTTIYGEFECTNRHHFGSLYMGSKALCFYGKLFGLERRIVMPYGDVVDIGRYKTNGILVRVLPADAAIAATTVPEEQVFYIDLSTLEANEMDASSSNASTATASDMDDVLNLLLDLKERFKSGFLVEEDDANSVSKRPPTEEPNRNSMRMSVRYLPHPLYRSNTAPLPMDEDDEMNPDGGIKQVQFASSTAPPKEAGGRPSMTGQRTNSQALAAVTAMADFRSFSIVYDSKKKLQELAKLTHDLEQETPEEAKKIEEEKEKEEVMEETEDLVPKPDDMKQAWKILKDTTVPLYKENALQSIKLACNLDTFYKDFLANDAPHSLAKYMETHGDTELNTTKWKTTRKGFVQKRSVSYVHPVNAPMAPPQAAAQKKQWFRRYGDCGLVVDTRTQVQDVPMTDCFLMEDRLWVEPTPDGRGVILNARFEVRFVKSTMFRRIIEKTSKEEFFKFIKGFGQMILKQAGPLKAPQVEGEPTPQVEAAEVALAPPSAAAPVMTQELGWIVMGVGAVFLLMHLALLFELRSLSSSVKELQKANLELVSQLVQTLSDAATCASSANGGMQTADSSSI